MRAWRRLPRATGRAGSTGTAAAQQEERLYFAIPSTYPGTEGTHFDTVSLFGYDDSGQRWRVEEASGTIRRTVYDLFGRT